MKLLAAWSVAFVASCGCSPSWTGENQLKNDLLIIAKRMVGKIESYKAEHGKYPKDIDEQQLSLQEKCTIMYHVGDRRESFRIHVWYRCQAWDYTSASAAYIYKDSRYDFGG